MVDIGFVAKRLKEARLRARLSQKQLGIQAGIDEFSASPRMNQYERNKHLPDMATAVRLANVLGVPVAYLFCPEDDLAELLLDLNQIPKTLLPQVRQYLRGLRK